MTNFDGLCTICYLVGEIDAKAPEKSNYFQTRLVFCKQFWGLTALDIQVRKSIGCSTSRQVEFDLNLLSDEYGEPAVMTITQ